jgi:hypothetical protein
MKCVVVIEFGQGQNTLFARPAVRSKVQIGLNNPCVCVSVVMFAQNVPIAEQDVCESVMKEVHQIINGVLSSKNGMENDVEYQLGVSVHGIPIHSGLIQNILISLF